MPNTSPHTAHQGRILLGNLGLATSQAIVFEPGYTGGGESERRTPETSGAPRIECVPGAPGISDHVMVRPETQS